MRNFFALILFLLGVQYINAQVEQLTPLNFNPKLYYSRIGSMPQANNLRYLVDSGYTVIKTDTLHLPFVDDFSTDKTPNYLWRSQHTTATYYNVISGCLGPEGFSTVQGTFITTPSWTYTWDYTNHLVDSFPQNPLTFTYFGSGSTDCFSGTPQILLYWPAYSRYPDWDTLTGYPIDSVVVGTPDTINYAPVVNFAEAQPGTLWFDNYAYINNTYPINPPTIGVATLDGLNQYGLPYNNSSTSTYGIADYLTSNPIDMSAYGEADSVYLSFFFEAQGNGDYPDLNDSLVVQFRDAGGVWNTVWADTGYSYHLWVPDTFAQVLIKVPSYSGAGYPYFDPSFHTFQFRFYNEAALFGNNNHWHIDYVKLDKNRSSTDSVIRDQAFVYPFPTILKNYTQETARQFSLAPDLADSITILLHNLNPIAVTNPPATDFTKSAKEIYPTAATIAGNLVTINAGPSSYTSVMPSVEYHIPAASYDSLVITSQAYISTNDVILSNDTITHTQTFGHVMAYDDGSAEIDYGVTGDGLKKFAYEFNLNAPDTLVAFQVMYTHKAGDIHDLIFDFEAWDTISLNSYNFIDSAIFTLSNQAPYYIDSLNGFTTYVLDTPMLIPKHFYFGWAQVDDRSLQIGYDVNSPLGRNHMFFYASPFWDSTSTDIPGSAMIRLVLGGAYWQRSSNTVGINQVPKDENSLEAFPNPSSSKVRLRASFPLSSLQVSVINDIGQVVMYLPSVVNEIDITGLSNGLYMLNATDPQTGKTYHTKIVKASN